MNLNKVTKITIVAVTFAMAVTAKADVLVYPKETTKASDPDKKGDGKPEVKYDFVQDTTKVDSEVISFDPGVNYSGDQDLVFTKLRFRYSFEGKAAKRPSFVVVEIHDFSADSVRTLKNLFLRFGDKKVTVPLKDNSKKSSSDMTVLNGEGRIDVTAFEAMGRAKEIYFKMDDDARVFVVNEPYTQVIKALTAMIPQAKKPPAGKK